MADWINKIKNVIMGTDEEEYAVDAGYENEYEEEQQYEEENNASAFGRVRDFASFKANNSSSRGAASGTYGRSYSTGFGGGFSSAGSSKVVNLNANVNIQVVVTTPNSMQEAAEVCEELKDKKTVIVNLEGLDKELAQRITDFFCGASYALDGSVQPVSNRIIIVGPYGVNITGQFREELEAASGLKLSGNAGWR
jgi:cell division inhibitor SepF